MNQKIFPKALTILLLIVINLSGCSSNRKLVGIYIDIYEDTHYLNLNKDGSFIDNWLTTTQNGNMCITEGYIYKIDKEGLITIIDTNVYENQTSLNEYQLGYLYKDYICSAWDGTLPKTTQEDTVVSSPLGYRDFYKFTFNSDGTYNYEVTVDGVIQEDSNETGAYTVDKNVITCISDNDVVTTFFDTENGVLCAEYVRE